MRKRKRKIAALLAAALLLCVLPACGGKGSGTKQPDDKGLYRIVSTHSGRAMASRDFGLQEGAFAELQAFAGDLNQVWRMLRQDDGSYVLENLSCLTRLTVKQDDDSDGVQACVKTGDPAELFKWELEYRGDDVYAIKSAATGKYLQSLKDNKMNGTPIVQWEKDGGESQEWELVKLDDGTRELPVMLMLSGSVEHSSTPEIQRVGNGYYLCAMQDGVSIKYSKDMRNWTKIGNVISNLTGMPFSWMREVIPSNETSGIWAPGIYKVGERFCLYYTLSVNYKQTSAIGLMTNTTLDHTSPEYKWADRGPVVVSKVGDDFNAIDPNVIHDDDGQAWLVYGSSWTGIKLRKLDMKTGLTSQAEPEVYSLASRESIDRAIEAPYMIKRGEYYYLFCAVEPMERNYRWAVGRSKSVTGPFTDRKGVDMMQGGSTDVTQGKQGVELPGHASVFVDDDGSYYMVTEYFKSNSNSLLGIGTMLWDDEGWPVTALSPNLFPKK